MSLLDWDVLPEFFIFATIVTLTPGANNVLTFLHTVRSGVWSAVVFRAGVLVAFPLMTVLVLVGLSPFMKAYPTIIDILTYVALAVTAYVSYQIWTSTPDLSHDDKPLLVSGFWGAVFFQVFNGKAWSMALSAISLYINPELPLMTQSFTLWSVFSVTNVMCAIPWIVGGVFLRQWLLQSTNRLVIFNKIMAVLLVITVGASL